MADGQVKPTVRPGSRCPNVALLVGIFALGFEAEAQQAPADSSDWQVYRNARYGYEIRYPNGFELWPTGPVGERDGRAVRIALREHAAPVPVLDVRVLSETAAEPWAAADLPDMDVALADVEVNGVRSIEVTYRWKVNGDIAFVDWHVQDTLIQFHAQPGLRDVRETVWWKIISTFRQWSRTDPGM